MRWNLNVIIIFGILCKSAKLDDKPCPGSCAKFTVEERCLEKTVRLELKVEQLTKDFRRLEETVLSVLQHREENMQEIADGLKQQVADLITGKKNAPSVSFSAYHVSKTTLQQGEVFLYQDVFVNHGDAYSIRTGVFTAPVNGTYFFSSHACNADTKCAVPSIVHENKQIALTNLCDEAGYASCGSVDTVIDLKSGERVWVQAVYPTYLQENAGRRASFVGFLVNKE